MSRRLATAGLAAFPLVAALSGQAQAASRSWQVTDFSRLRVEAPFDVRVHTGGPSSVRATGPQAAIDRLDIEQHGDTLVVRTNRSTGGANWSWNHSDPLIVEVSTHALADAALTGSGNVAIDRLRGDAVSLSLGGAGDLSVADIDVATAKLFDTGSGNLTIKGRARRADAVLTGAGDIQGNDFTADAATAKLIGSGSLTMAATHTAAVDASGAGDVTIGGTPACTVHRSGSGDVRCGKSSYGD